MISQIDQMLKRTAATLAAAATLSLAGCAVTTGAPGTAAVTMGTINGSVHGGQQPVGGAQVYLLAVGQNGYGTGNNSNSLLTTSTGYVTTTSGGGFSITGDYTCPANAQVYLVSLGGNPGLAAGTNNGALVLMAGLGACSALTASTNITINEVSTAAMTYALAGFMSNYAQVSSSQTNAAGIQRAFASIPNMIDVATGTPLATTPSGNGAVPVAEINTLADAIAPCVNSNGSDGNCTALFNATTIPGGNAPSDTAGALLSIAQNPGQNVAAIFSLVNATSPFQPTLSTAPNDFSLAINYSGGSLSQPYGIALDSAGTVYTSNSGTNSISSMDYLGNAQQTISGSGILDPRGVAVDTTGVVYVTSFGSGIVTRIASGTVTTLSGSGLNNPIDVAIDGNNSVYVANQGGNSISKFAPTGAPTGPAITGGGLSLPSGIAVDGTGQVFVANMGNSSISKLNPITTTFYSPTGYTGGGLLQPSGLAFDATSNIFLPNSDGSVSRFDNSGNALTGSAYTGGGSGAQGGVAIDGQGHIFVADTSNSIKELLNNGGTPLSPTTGYTGGGVLNGPTRLVLDASGNLWVANNGSGSTSVTEFIGLGAPTAVPLASAVANGTLGQLP